MGRKNKGFFPTMFFCCEKNHIMLSYSRPAYIYKFETIGLKDEKRLNSRIVEIFEDESLAERIRRKLPSLFTLAEVECARAGKIGMEVGSLRERIIVALLIYKFGEENVETEIPITEPEVDARVFGEPISIKTITGKSFGGVKEALSTLVGDSDSKCIIMNWQKTEMSFNPYNRWVDLWRDD